MKKNSPAGINFPSFRESYWSKLYHQTLKDFVKFYVEEGRDVLALGKLAGELLKTVKPARGVGVDSDSLIIKKLAQKYKSFTFKQFDIEQNTFDDKFDYIFAIDVISDLADVQKTLSYLNNLTYSHTRLIFNYHNFLWEPILKLAAFLGLIQKRIDQNWLSPQDVKNLLYLTGFEIVKEEQFLLLPIYIPFVTAFLNKILASLPLIRNFCLINFVVARPKPVSFSKQYTVSVIVPVRNEEKNILGVIKRMPEMGTHCEIIFVEGGSKDKTREEIFAQIKNFEGQKDISFVPQDKGGGKANAVRLGFAEAKGEILAILDGDLTVAPEDLPKFYEAIASGKGEFINGSRLVYKLEKDSMRLLNIFGNKFFSFLFTWLLAQPIKDTLCGTKVLFAKDYKRIKKQRKFFGDFDPFGDFDLLFGASKLALKILEIPIRYKARTYGSTNINRFEHGWLLLKMSFLALKKFKFAI